jgi:hypothetical protein
LTVLGRHIQSTHPDKFQGRQKQPKHKIAAKAIQAMNVAKEINRLARKGVRFLPKSRLDRTTIGLVNEWLKQQTVDPEAKKTLMLGALENVESSIRTDKQFLDLQASIKQSLKTSSDAVLPALYSKSTWFDTETASEILKLAYALGKTWSFAVHLLLLYGLTAMAEEVSSGKLKPPTLMAHPAKETLNDFR